MAGKKSTGKGKNQPSARKQKLSKPKKSSMAAQVDRHVLYQESVQCVESEIDFLDETFHKIRGRKAVVIREDFCGTANTSCEWVRRRAGNRAIGVDIDPEVIGWGRENNVAKLSKEAQGRIALHIDDVLKVKTEKVDALLAMNFSYWLFKERKTMIHYFRTVRDALVDDGVLFLDAYGGYDAYRTIREPRECEGFKYIWEQADYDPMSGSMKCHIHFVFPDGSRIRRAFSYEWRLWSLPELREMLDEAGFRKVSIYWEGADEETGDGNGEFEVVERGDPDPGWICYLVAEK